MQPLFLTLLLLANLADFLEGRRLRAPVVYVGKVVEVRSVGAFDRVASPRAARMEATLQLIKVLRAPEAVTTGAPAQAVIRYDQADPEPEGGIYYKLAPGEVAVVFTRSLDKEYPIQLLNGPVRAVKDGVLHMRDNLAGLDADGLRLHGVTEAQRPDQVKMYESILAALGN